MHSSLMLQLLYRIQQKLRNTGYGNLAPHYINPNHYCDNHCCDNTFLPLELLGSQEWRHKGSREVGRDFI